jgi:flagellar hook-length control protein FliK
MSGTVPATGGDLLSPLAASLTGAAGDHAALLAAAHGLGGAHPLPPSAAPTLAAAGTLTSQDGTATASAADLSLVAPMRTGLRGADGGAPSATKNGRSAAVEATPTAGDALTASDQAAAAAALAAAASPAPSSSSSADGSTGGNAPASSSTAEVGSATAAGSGGALDDPAALGSAIDPTLPQPRLEAGSASAQLQDPPANPMEKAVANQVSRSLVQNLPGGDRLLVVRLTPPELGTVRVEVVEHQGTLTAHLHAEDDGVRLAIEHYLPTMRAELRAHDAPIREISLTDQAPGRSFSDGQQQWSNRQQSTSARDSAGGERFAIAASAAAAAPGATTLGGTIDASGVDWRA